MKKLLIIILLFYSQSIYAKVGNMRLPEKVRASDLIAVVKITSISDKASSYYKGDLSYRCIANGKVIKSIKGQKDGYKFKLIFGRKGKDDAFYHQGEKLLIFAIKITNDMYYTCNAYNGKKRIENNHIKGWKKNIPCC